MANDAVAAPKKHPRKPQPPPPKVAPSQPTAASAKSLIDGVAENGATITNQVLAPLDTPSIPEAVINTWREDLLDEAGKETPDSQPMYKQATYLLTAWQNALRERPKLIRDTKFSGGVMDTVDMDSSRKTQLHFWDWLTYARERDDARAHQRKAVQKAEFFASGPAKIWSDRSNMLRATIDRQFQVLRALRRELLQKRASAQQQQ